MGKVLIIFAHPDYAGSRINRHMLEALGDEDVLGTTIHKLYDEYPDFKIDVAREQQLMIEHDAIVLHHPTYWYSCPALLKEWIDRTLIKGFAYGPGGDALERKKLVSCVSTGAPEWSYGQDGFNSYPLSDFLKVFEKTAEFCHMRYGEPLVMYDTHRASDEQLAEHSRKYRAYIEELIAETP
jgi:glutathione-regulated potassium-efflux system ancillary protein KefG